MITYLASGIKVTHTRLSLWWDSGYRNSPALLPVCTLVSWHKLNKTSYFRRVKNVQVPRCHEIQAIGLGKIKGSPEFNHGKRQKKAQCNKILRWSSLFFEPCKHTFVSHYVTVLLLLLLNARRHQLDRGPQIKTMSKAVSLVSARTCIIMGRCIENGDK